jgi:hypothetical protein
VSKPRVPTAPPTKPHGPRGAEEDFACVVCFDEGVIIREDRNGSRYSCVELPCPECKGARKWPAQ